MDNAQKAIVVGVALFITIIIVAAVMLITGIGTNLLNKGTDKASNIAAQLDQTELEQYDNTVMSGALVTSAIRKYNTDTNILVYVKANGNYYRTTPSGYVSGNDIRTSITSIVKSDDGKTENTSGDGKYRIHQNGNGTINTGSSPSISDFIQMGTSRYISANSQWHAYLLKRDGDTIGVVFEPV